ncbi:MAG: hypothetical protein LKE55_03165 [Prevotella sp.]|jgi:hypothetical protein|nr:hypothetical protein [Prevotella sp.]
MLDTIGCNGADHAVLYTTQLFDIGFVVFSAIVSLVLSCNLKPVLEIISNIPIWVAWNSAQLE